MFKRVANMSRARLLTAMLLVITVMLAWDQSRADSLSESERIEQLLMQMTVEEKVGQLTQLGTQSTPTGPVVKTKASLPLEKAGSLIGTYGADITRQFQQQAVQRSRLHIPLLFSLDVIHGFRTVFPVPLAEASAWDPDLWQRTARAAAIEASASGLHWTFAPMVDIARDPRWGRGVEGAGEDPFLGSSVAVAKVRGLRGDEADHHSLLSTAKHFVAYGAAEAGRDYNVADLSERTLHETYLPPFRAAVEAGVDAIMPGFNEIAGIPMHANRQLLDDTLRKQWGFDGVVISDYTGVHELIDHGVASTPISATALAIKAGVDIDMVSGNYVEQLPALVRNGQLAQRWLDDAVRRVLQAKQKLGLFDDPYRYSDKERERTHVLTPQTRALAREAAQKSIVLLKNDNTLLPLAKNLRKLVVVGSLATDARSTLGSWPGAGRPEESVTVLEGIKRAVSAETEVVYMIGAAPDDNKVPEHDVTQRMVADADAVIAVLGETADMSGEARSRTLLGLPGAQNALLQQLIETGRPLIVILMNGRPLALPEMADKVPAILETWFLGSEMGHGVADVVFGDVNPSAKLPITFPRAVGQIPIYHSHKNTGRPPANENAYTSKYIDQPWTPLYPFGHGLSYTTFSYSSPQLSATQLKANEQLKVQVSVRNTGLREGEEIVQLYLRDEEASVTRPVRTLRGFTKVKLTPGEARTVEFLLDQDDFALLDEHFLRVVEAGTFSVFVGGSSTTDNRASFRVIDTVRLPDPGSAIPRMLRATTDISIPDRK
ncbi:beta-glucosidase [Pseudomonas orientalis]|uniref:beta-glucosidase BglX n=1 Tax=Pseudomonas orientalis TaxID=76758 RepID=UPI000F6F3C2C|nr:beta-glucosidase BglX [Pseudomonas orientalis]AZE98600.1 beta-glucosidase [Pseudomonas orientalis]